MSSTETLMCIKSGTDRYISMPHRTTQSSTAINIPCRRRVLFGTHCSHTSFDHAQTQQKAGWLSLACQSSTTKRKLFVLLLIDHPAIIAIALDIMFAPSRRVHYSEFVLALADAALDRIRLRLDLCTAEEILIGAVPKTGT